MGQALAELDATPGISVSARSGFYETEPIGVVDQPKFLNAAAEIETELAPLELLNVCKAIEERLGRVRNTDDKWGPRVIDIDIVLWGDRVDQLDGLTIPHPEFRTRQFVLAPLEEIGGEVVDPVTGKTVAELAEAPEAQGGVRRVNA